MSEEIKTYHIEEIMKMLPHRYPFLLVDRLEVEVPGEKGVGIKNVTMNEEFFQGHFPNNPVMPGVLQIEAMAQTAGAVVISQDENERNYLFDKLRQKFLEYDKSHGFDSDGELLNKLKKTELNLHFKFEIAKFKEQLQKTNSEDEIEYLNAKIRQMELQYQKEIDY